MFEPRHLSRYNQLLMTGTLYRRRHGASQTMGSDMASLDQCRCLRPAMREMPTAAFWRWVNYSLPYLLSQSTLMANTVLFCSVRWLRMS